MTQLFENVVQKPRSTSRGPCELPILYRDGSWFGVFYRIDVARANRLLDGTGLEAMPLLGKALVTIQAWEYRDSTVGRYGELGLGIQTRKRGSAPSLLKYALDQRKQPDQGIWVVTLPVTTEPAWAAGVEIWGYPKYVTPIETRFDDRAYVRLGDELEMTLDPVHGPATPSVPLVTFTGLGGRMVRTVIETHSKMRWGSGGRARVRLLGGEGKTASAVRKLGLEDEKPLLAFRCDAFRAVLPAGEDVGFAMPC